MAEDIKLRLQLDANDGIQSLRDLKKEIKDAQGDVVAMSEKFGATSEQARQAAQRVAELQDSLSDAKALTETFNPDKKFVALGQSLQGVLGGFTALTGAMGLLGVESEDVQKQLLKVQSAMAFSQGLNQVGDSIQSFKNLGKTLVDTLGKGGLIGVAIAGVGALAAAFSGLFERNKLAEQSLKAYAEGSIKARSEVTNLNNSIAQAKLGIISKEDALNEYNNTIGKTIGQAKSLDEAEKLMAKNADAYVKVQALKSKANFLLGESAKLAGEAELKRLAVEQVTAGGFVGAVRDKALKEAADAEKRAADIQKRVDKINEEIRTASAGFEKVVAKQPVQAARIPVSAKQEKEEEKKRTLEFSTEADNRLLKYQQFKDNFLATKNLLLEEQKKIDDEELKSAQEKYYADLAAFEEAQQRKIMFAEMERKARIDAAADIGNALGALSDLIGQQTAAGKVLGIAQATINTWIGVTEVLRSKSILPEPIATISKIANIATIVASGIKAVKNIVKVQVPGKGGGGGGGGQTIAAGTAPAPLAPQAQQTILNQGQLNQIGNAAVRAFVVESDVTNNQQRIRRLNRAARIG